jgi:hypothetical protein
MLKIFYGINGYYRDITESCFYNLKNNNIITIPQYDNERAYYFNDHIPDILKHIRILIDDNEYIYGNKSKIQINILNNEIMK